MQRTGLVVDVINLVVYNLIEPFFKIRWHQGISEDDYCSHYQRCKNENFSEHDVLSIGRSEGYQNQSGIGRSFLAVARKIRGFDCFTFPNIQTARLYS